MTKVEREYLITIEQRLRAKGESAKETLDAEMAFIAAETVHYIRFAFETFERLGGKK